MKRVAVVSFFVIMSGVAGARAEGTAEVRCQDGTTAPAGRGACSQHGGIVSDDGVPDSPAATTEAAAQKRAGAGTEPMVRCKDGTTTRPGRGACAHHGGVDRAAAEETAAPERPDREQVKPGHRSKAELKTPAPSRSSGEDERTGSSVSEPNGHDSKADLKTPSPRSSAGDTAIARCQDGTLSYAKHRSGACSNHGGVVEWLDGGKR